MNTQITEDYVSFETAKLLKEKGFCLSTKTAYNQQGIFNLCEGFTNGVKSLCNADFDRYYNSNFISAPTLQMAMKWLREVHGLNVQPCIVRTIELKKAYNVTIYNNNCEQIKPHFGRNIFDGFKSYEQACEAAIKYCLTNLI